MKPIIGIVSRPLLRDNEVRLDAVNNMSRRTIIKNGGIPLGVLPSQDINYYDTLSENIPKLTDEEKEDIIKQINLCDGILFQGGNRWYEYDEFILNYVIEHDIPALLICMGMQLLNAVDLYSLNKTPIREEVGGHNSKDDYVHNVNIKEDSILYRILNKNTIKVNSMHRYAIKETGIAKEVASTEEGIIEAIEYPDKKFILGLQWHPEKMIDYDEDENKIIKYFIEKAKSQ